MDWFEPARKIDATSFIKPGVPVCYVLTKGGVFQSARNVFPFTVEGYLDALNLWVADHNKKVRDANAEWSKAQQNWVQALDFFNDEQRRLR